MTNTKEPYETPVTEVIKVEQEGHIMQMSGIPNYGGGNDPLNP